MFFSLTRARFGSTVTSTRRANTRRNFRDSHRITGGTGGQRSETALIDGVSCYDDSLVTINQRMKHLGIHSNPDEILECISVAADKRYRTPLRDSSLVLISQLPKVVSSGDIGFNKSALYTLAQTGKGMVYLEELFQFLVDRQDTLTGSELACLIYECGRHGLRSKHFLDSIVKNSPDSIVRRISAADIPMALKGVCRFAADYRQFVESAIRKLEIKSLQPHDVLITMRTLRQIKDGNELVNLLRATDWTQFSTVDKLNCLHLLKRARGFRFPADRIKVPISVAHRLVKELEQELVGNSIPSDVIVTDFSDCLDAMASWRIHNPQLVQVMMDFLVSRAAEIKYSPICGLWQAITDSCGHLGFFHGPWMRIVEDMGSSEFNLKSFAAFQLVFFISSLGRLNFYSEKVFSAVARVLVKDISSINDMDMLATLLFPLSRVDMECPDLVDAVLNQATRIMGKKRRLDKDTVRGSVTVSYCAAALGADPKDIRLKNLIGAVDSFVSTEDAQYLLPPDHVHVSRLVSLGVLEKAPRWLSGHKETAIPFVDFKKSDGTLVVVEQFEEPMMKWKDPEDHKSYELVPVETSGSRKMIQSFLRNRGITTVEFVSSPS